MDWKQLLSTQKLNTDNQKEPKEFSQYPINEFEKDYNRIVSNSAFRRLQDKTQVFPLDKSDFVRTRLTHSIEVSTIARQLGIMISKNETKYKHTDIDAEDAEGIASVLLCAGLLHDLGNPPFGHFGEDVIGNWFKENLPKIQYKGKSLKEWLNPQMIADLENFEGNAQALRILIKGQNNSDINLSYAIISTLVKYPTNSLSFDKKSSDIKKHKLGYFFAEQDKFMEIANAVGTVSNEEVYRHPLTYLLEAADDIAYATADLEDAFKKGLFTLDDFTNFFRNSCIVDENTQKYDPKIFSNIIIDELCKYRETTSYDSDNKAFSAWLNYTRRWLMYVVVYSFSLNYTQITNGKYNDDLFVNTNHALTIDILKNAMKKFAYNSHGILRLELSAQTILSFLLNNFIHAVLYYDDMYQDKSEGYKPSNADYKYIELISENHKIDYNSSKTGNEAYDLYLRLLMVTDYISGMTDSFARTLYRELSGIE